MTRTAVKPTGIESPFGRHELIITKADLTGHITYANGVFLRVSKYTLKEVLGAPHSLIRHPGMPRCIFKLLWETIEAKKEFFGYILNLAADGDHYWTFAHVTATLNDEQDIVGFHSSRRKANQAQLAKIKELYAALRAEENRSENPQEGMLRSYDLLAVRLRERFPECRA
jgi:PAS domain-containing protein